VKISLRFGVEVLILGLIMSAAFIYGMYQSSLMGARSLETQYKIHRLLQEATHE